MRVDTKVSGLPLSNAAPQRGVAGTRFSLDQKGGPSEAKRAASAAPLVTMDALIAVQGQEDPTERRRRSLRRGHDLLHSLDRLKAALLSGRVQARELQDLGRQLVGHRSDSGDSGLDEVVAHIELRAQVELAKLGKARG
jgi:hypothetical protein